ncbi:hypothetical protein DPSP01_008969 [Paraphaeosphaeria sporulosa]
MQSVNIHDPSHLTHPNIPRCVSSPSQGSTAAYSTSRHAHPLFLKPEMHSTLLQKEQQTTQRNAEGWSSRDVAPKTMLLFGLTVSAEHSSVDDAVLTAAVVSLGAGFMGL